MIKISNFKVSPADMGKFINNFWVAITLLQGKDEVKEFLKDLLTHTEMQMLSKRLQIAKMLIEGHGYETIKNYVKVTDQTIARINNLLSDGGQGFTNAITLLQKYEYKKQKELEENYNPVSLKKYPENILPEQIGELIQEQIKRHKRRKSV